MQVLWLIAGRLLPAEMQSTALFTYLFMSVSQGSCQDSARLRHALATWIPRRLMIQRVENGKAQGGWWAGLAMGGACEQRALPPETDSCSCAAEHLPLAIYRHQMISK